MRRQRTTDDAVGEALDRVESTLAVHTQAVRHLRDVYDDAQQPTPPDDQIIYVHAGEDLRSILESAPPAAVVRCEAATYQGPFILTKPITLRADHEIDGRAGLDMPVWLTSGAEDTVSMRGPDQRVLGLGIKNTNPDYQLLAVTREATRTLIDQVSCLGDPVYGQRRGIRPEGTGVVIRRSYVDHIGRVGLETQAVCGIVGGRNILIDDSHLAGAAEAVMFGGGDTPSSDLTPTSIRITRSTLTKRPEWFQMGWQIKNSWELKNARNVYVADTDMGYAGMAEGQGAYSHVYTPRNQDGGSPWACVEDVLIERCRCAIAGGCLSLMGSDYMHKSGMLRNITIRDVLFEEIDPWGITGGTGNCIYIQRAPEHVTIERVTIRGQHLNAALYFGPDMPPPWCVLRDIVVPPEFTNPHENDPYLWKIDGGGQGEAAVRAFCTFPDDASKNIVIERVGTPDAAGASGYPV
jgi:hypothetical protein